MCLAKVYLSKSMSRAGPATLASSQTAELTEANNRVKFFPIIETCT